MQLEPPPVWTPVVSWSNPRVWLREAVKAISAWLNKPTKAEMADVEAWKCAAVKWSSRACGESASGSTQQGHPEAPAAMAPLPPERGC